MISLSDKFVIDSCIVSNRKSQYIYLLVICIKFSNYLIISFVFFLTVVYILSLKTNNKSDRYATALSSFTFSFSLHD